MSYLVASEIGCFFGFSTNCLPQELHLNLGFPLPKPPFLTMSLEEQFGQLIVKSLRDFRSAHFIIISLEFQDYPKKTTVVYTDVCQRIASSFRETSTLLALPLSQASKLLDQAHDNIPVNAEIQSAAEKLDTHSRGDGKVSDF